MSPSTSTSDSCPFCEIVQSLNSPKSNSTPYDEKPHIVLSTPHALAFLDRLPLTKGHTLLIPTNHYELLCDIPACEAAELGRVLPTLCRAVMKISGADAFNVVQNNGVSAGQVVPHVHFHIVPRYREFSSATMFGKGQRDELDEEEGEEVSRKMRQIIEEEGKMDKAKL